MPGKDSYLQKETQYTEGSGKTPSKNSNDVSTLLGSGIGKGRKISLSQDSKARPGQFDSSTVKGPSK